MLESFVKEIVGVLEVGQKKRKQNSIKPDANFYNCKGKVIVLYSMKISTHKKTSQSKAPEKSGEQS